MARADAYPHRAEGEGVLVEQVPRDARRILDLGTGDGRLLALLQIDRREIHGVGLDFSELMLEAARERFADDERSSSSSVTSQSRCPRSGASIAFFAAIGEPLEDEDPSDRLLDVETQLGWLRELSFDDVDCYWKWLEMALLVGVKPHELR